MDLCYYESPPGLQLLHCMENDEAVGGGHSFLIDGFGAAEMLRNKGLHHFDAAARIPATFIKDHSRREQPVAMSYQRPHIAVDSRRRVVGFFWSPPFEGPLRVPFADVPLYYAAYRALHETIDSHPRWRRRLRPGELLIFNNRRMLHGRTEIEPPAEGSGSRWLRGCYVNIDEFANCYNKLRARYASGTEPSMQHLGNQDWAVGPCSLPAEGHDGLVN